MNEVIEQEVVPIEVKVVVKKSGENNELFKFFLPENELIPFQKNQLELGISTLEACELKTRNYWSSSNYSHHLPSVFRDALNCAGVNISRRQIEKIFVFCPEFISSTIPKQQPLPLKMLPART